MELKTVKIVEVLPMAVWAEKDAFGTVHIKMQHEGYEVFDFIQLQYDYAYTSNGHQHYLTQRILALLGVPVDTPIAKPVDNVP